MSLLEHGTVVFGIKPEADHSTRPSAREAYGQYLTVGATCTEAYLADRSVGAPEGQVEFIAARAAWDEARMREGVPEGKFF
jgi:hypothetical protein